MRNLRNSLLLCHHLRLNRKVSFLWTRNKKRTEETVMTQKKNILTWIFLFFFVYMPKCDHLRVSASFFADGIFVSSSSQQHVERKTKGKNPSLSGPSFPPFVCPTEQEFCQENVGFYFISFYFSLCLSKKARTKKKKSCKPNPISNRTLRWDLKVTRAELPKQFLKCR